METVTVVLTARYLFDNKYFQLIKSLCSLLPTICSALPGLPAIRYNFQPLNNDMTMDEIPESEP
jgi:hypothetical protein